MELFNRGVTETIRCKLYKVAEEINAVASVTLIKSIMFEKEIKIIIFKTYKCSQIVALEFYVLISSSYILRTQKWIIKLKIIIYLLK